MPKIINPYVGDNTYAKSFSDFAGSFFANTPQTELARQKAHAAVRENENIGLLADAIVAGDRDAATRHGILSGAKPEFTGGYDQYRTVHRYGAGSRQATDATMAVPGANYGNTVAGERESQANRRVIENMRTERLFDAERYKADNTPYSAIVDGQPKTLSRSEAIRLGARPVLSATEVEGTIRLNDLPKMDALQRATAGGYAPKSASALYSYRDPTGITGTTADGRTDLNSGQPLPQGTQVIKLEGPSTEGLTGNNAIDRELLTARNNKDILVSNIDGLVAELSKPNADQAIGWIGSGARLFNDARAQVEATVRLYGGTSKTQEFMNPELQSATDRAVQSIFGDSALNSRAQQLGITANVLRSRIQDVAYMVAKAQDPSGRMSNQDIERAGQTIGAAIMDPTAGIAVLQDMKNRAITAHDIRERNTRQMYPKMGGNAPNPGGAPAAAAPVDPAAPAGVQPNDPLGIRQ